jgi:Uncharacterized conserved protein
MADDELSIIQQMIDACTIPVADRIVAVRAIRTICKWYGGQLISIPRSAKNSTTADDLRGIIADEIGDPDAEKIVSCLMNFFGGTQLYIPMETRAFSGEIAREIYARYNGTTESMREICREYKISYMQVYRLYHRAADELLQNKFDF